MPLSTATPGPSADDSAAASRSRGRRASRVSLLSKVLGVNTVIIVGTVFLASLATQIDVSTSEGLNSFLVAVVAMLTTVLVNGWILRRQFRPLEALGSALDEVDLERPKLELRAPRGEPADVQQLRLGVEAMLDRLDQERRRRVSAVIDAQEAERARLARDLHDEVNQSLTGIMLRLSAIAADAEPRVREQLQEVRDLTDHAMRELLRLSHDLRPSTLDDLGLSAALAARLRQLRTDTKLAVDTDLDSQLPELSPEQQTVLFRVAQEGISNVIQHAEASRIRVELREIKGGRVVLRITDDGRGMGSYRPPAPGSRRHAGVAGMRERALLVGGHLSLRSSRKGTTLELTLGGADPADRPTPSGSGPAARW